MYCTGVSSASVTMDAPHGTISHEWQRSGGVQCAKAPEVLGCLHLCMDAAYFTVVGNANSHSPLCGRV